MIRLIVCALGAIGLLISPAEPLALSEIKDGDQPVLVEPRTGMQFVALQGGCFVMADMTSEVCVDDFAMGRFEVTNSAYRAFDSNHDSGQMNGASLSEDEWPVVNVAWSQANEFASWLSDETELQFRLPTEAEWEYAAHGGTESPWFWGETPELAYRFANLSARDADGRLVDGFDATAPIASFDPNPFGLFDMLGNVSEWVLDAYDGSAERFGDDLTNPLVSESDGPLRVRRGGSFDQRISQTSVTTRDFYLESLGVPQTGFRLVLELPQ